MIDLNKNTVGNVTENYDRKRVPLSRKERKSIAKVYPYYGAQGVIDHVDDYLFDGEYLLVAEDGENLKSQSNNICNIVEGKFWVNNHAHILKGKADNNTQYLYYLLNLVNYRNYVTGSAQPKLTKDNLNSIQIFIHYPVQQKKIAKVLSTLDKKIELNNRINTELESMAKTLYDYWFVQFDFPNPSTNSGQFGKPYKSSGGKMVFNEVLKREIPEGWESGIASDLFEFNPTTTLKKGKSSSYIDMNALPTDGFMTKDIQTKKFSGGVKFKNGDLVVARITPCLENGKTGLVTLLKNDEIGFGSTEFIVLRGKSESLSSFASYLSRSEHFRKYAIANMTGTSGRKRVDAKALDVFSLPIPDVKLLEKFEKIVGSFFKIETNNTKENQQLTQLRDWLLPMLMNGQVTVK